MPIPPAADKTTDDYALSVENLGFAYEKSQHPVISGLTAKVKKGDIAAILGANGCGKTTLLKLLVGALSPTQGALRAHGVIAYVPQQADIAFDYSVLDIVLMGRARQIGRFSLPGQKDRDAAIDALSRFGMSDFAPRLFRELSGGERQLALLARALVAQADIILLDEPASALDIRHQAVVLQWVHRLARDEGLTILFTTHHPHHAEAVAQHVLLMFGEQDYLWGDTRTVLTEKNLSRLYRASIARLSFTFNGKTLETFAPVFDL
ncbi:MAG: ABC transporter ATP-binding protein [Burkholderiales bacterium]|jgi:iron complex transport system ATP-binding protein|nr:ABC transporter ATP-binding protein [Burkholderiales bacterium]